MGACHRNGPFQDIGLPPDKKRGWRVFRANGISKYDYAVGAIRPAPFTTIAWMVNHIAQTVS